MSKYFFKLYLSIIKGVKNCKFSKILIVGNVIYKYLCIRANSLAKRKP